MQLSVKDAGSPEDRLSLETAGLPENGLSVKATLPLSETCLLGLIIAFYFSLFLPDMPVVNNVLIAAIFACCLLFNSPAEKWRLLRSRAGILLMLLFFVLQTISALVSVNLHEGLSMLGLRSPLIVFPLSLGMITIRPVVKLRLLAGYCAATTLMTVFCLVHAAIRVWTTGDAEWLYDDSLTAIIGKQSVYIALMVTVAIFCYIYLLPFMRRPWRVYPAIALLLCFHYLLASRVSIFFLYGAMLLYGGSLAWQRRNRRSLLWAGALAILAVGCLFFFPKTLNRFRELQYTAYNYSNAGAESHYNMPVTSDQWNGANIRLAIWHCGLDLMPGHWFTGIPLGDKRAALVSQYKEKNFELAYRTRRNLHSTYLDVLVNTGIPGLIIFLLGYLVLPLCAAVACSRTTACSRTAASAQTTASTRTAGNVAQSSPQPQKRRDWLAIAITTAFAAAMITETWLDRSFGCILLGFFLTCIAAWQPSQKKSSAHLQP